MHPPRPPLWRVVLLYTALTVVLAYPLSIRPASRVMSAGPDTDLFVWTLSWDVHALIHQPFSMFDANIYYPDHRTLAYSENLIGSAPLAAPIVWLSGNSVLAMNLIVLAASMLCGLGAYLLACRLGVGTSGALLCGVIFAFAPPRFLRLDQFHLATIQWVPFGLASLHAYFDTRRKRDVRMAAAFLALQALTSGHGAVFLVLAMLVVICCRLALRERGEFIGRAADLGVPGVLLLIPAVLVLWPYRMVQQQMGLRRALEAWSVSWLNFLASPSHVDTFLASLVPSWHIGETQGPQLFPGVVPLVLALAAVVWAGRAGRAGRVGQAGRAGWIGLVAGLLEAAALACIALGIYVAITDVTRIKAGGVTLVTIRQAWRVWVYAVAAIAGRVAIAPKAPVQLLRWLLRCGERFGQWRAAHRNDPRVPYAVLTGLSLWLSVGSPVGLWPLVYWLPGLNFIRAPSRFTLLTVLGLAVLAAIGFERLASHLSLAARRVAAVVAGALLVVEFAAVPFALEAYRVDIPDIERWLAGQPKPFIVAEVPVGNPRNFGQWEQREATYMLHSTAHWQKTVHGYSGFRSALHQTLYAELAEFPSEQSVQHLIDLGVTDVIVHTDLYPPGDWAVIEQRIAAFSDRLTLKHVEGDGRVYGLRP
jgi:hypothetical protein